MMPNKNRKKTGKTKAASTMAPPPRRRSTRSRAGIRRRRRTVAPSIRELGVDADRGVVQRDPGHRDRKLIDARDTFEQGPAQAVERRAGGNDHGDLELIERLRVVGVGPGVGALIG